MGSLRAPKECTTLRPRLQSVHVFQLGRCDETRPLMKECGLKPSNGHESAYEVSIPVIKIGDLRWTAACRNGKLVRARYL
jgi:hypothetical protein